MSRRGSDGVERRSLLGGASLAEKRETKSNRDDPREQRRYEIARDVMAAKHGAYWGVSNPEGAARDAVYAADALLAALEETER